VDEPGDDLDPWLTQFDAYNRDYTRADLDGVAADGLAYYDRARAVWVIRGPAGSFEVRDADLPDASPDDHARDAYQTRFDGYTRAALDDLVDQGRAVYDQRGLWIVEGDTGPFEVRDVDAPAPGLTAGAGAWYEITYSGRGDTRRPVRTFDEEAARHVARHMSGTGQQVDVTRVASDGSRSVIGSYLGREPLPGAPGHGADPPPGLPPWPAAPIPPAARAAGPAMPVAPGDTRATQLQFPQGISPLPVTATSGGRLRPARLLYADGTPVDFRPMGDNESVPAVAAGVIPAAGGLAPGWLQVIQRGRGDLVAVHPALISPRNVSPLRWLPHRQLRRFGEFDSAEAAGRDSALLQATFVDKGDRIRTATGDIAEVTWITSCTVPGGLMVTIATTGPGGQADPQEYQGHQMAEVLIPAHHPAEDSPDAAHLFALPPPPSPRSGADPAQAELDDLEATLNWIRRDGSPAGPPDAREAPLPGRERGPASISMAEALQRGSGRAGPQADGAMPEQAGWGVSVRMTASMHQAQGAATAGIRTLSHNPAWLRLRSLTTSARRLAADASAGRLQFTDPAWALRSWRAVWARVCEMTCDLAAGMMTGWLRGPARHDKGSRPWQAARALHHAAAEGAAHAHGWLPREVRLPMGSYEPPGGRISAASARAKANAAGRRYQPGAGPLSQIDFATPPAHIAARARATRQGQRPAPPDRGRTRRAGP
jgi:hypothetical protein